MAGADGLILAIDQGTTGSTALLVDLEGRTLSRHTEEFRQHYPEPGWVEHDPEELWESVARAVQGALGRVPHARERLAAVGITNQRETTLLWDAETAAPLGRAIVWQDRRTAGHCEALVLAGHLPRVRHVTGLVLDPYFSATKVAWLLEQDSEVARRARSGEIQFGTVDSFLVKRLCGGPVAPHVIEVSNASRTLLLDLRTRRYSDEMCSLFGIPRAILPEIVPTAGIVGRTRNVPWLPDGVPIAGIAGDQQAALFGQGCLDVGDVKCTYGTGAFVLVNVGSEPVESEAGLLSTVAWEIEGSVAYALEGACFVSGAAVQWLRDGLGLIETAAEVEHLARSVPSSAGVVFVPALSGLGAPHWDPEARGLITGITRGTNRAHLARATLEAMALSVDDLLIAMSADLRAAGLPATLRLRVDGGASKNELLLELQAALSEVQVERPVEVESTGRGAALLAGVGAGLFPSLREASRRVSTERTVEPRAAASALGGASVAEFRTSWDRAIRLAKVRT